jgi:flagellar protein FlaF
MTQTTQHKVNVYAGHQQVQMDGREIDKRALLNCASRLKSALDNGGQDMGLYQEAVRHNQHLWTIFQVALADQGNTLPVDLKMNLLRLSGYVDRTSFRMIHEFSSQLLNSLIDINRIIAAGLNKKVAPQEGAATAVTSGVSMAPAGTPATIMTSA